MYEWQERTPFASSDYTRVQEVLPIAWAFSPEISGLWVCRYGEQLAPLKATEQIFHFFTNYHQNSCEDFP